MTLDPSTITRWLMGIIPDIVTAILTTLASAVGTQGTATWASMSASIVSGPARFVVSTPPELSYNMGAISDLYHGWEPALLAVMTLACVIAGIASLGRGYFGWSWEPGEYAARMFLGILLVFSLPRIYGLAIGLVNGLTGAILGAELPTIPGQDMDDITKAILVVVWVILGFRLLWRMAYRLVYLDVILVLGPLAMMCWVIPGAQSYARFWTKTFIGLLAGQVLVVICLRLAAVLAGPTGSTWAGIALGVGVLLLAYDMATLLTDIKGGGLQGVIRSTVQLARGKVV